MKVVRANTVDRGLQAVLTELTKHGNSIETPSRNGPVRRFRGPASILWNRPQYRVSFDPLRDANPAFHLFESLWMLSGENDVERPKYFASQMGQFSDDGVTFHGAYGHRWVKQFGCDQIRDYVIPALRKNKEDRRVLIQMWDARTDIPAAQNNGKDVPCNLMANFDAAQDDGRLHMSVWNRSNDLVWGATGANAVHFSILQEYIAAACELNMGTYEQISVNSHLYLELNEVSKRMLKTHEDDPARDLPYYGMISPLKHKSDGTADEWWFKFDRDVGYLMQDYRNISNTRFNTYFFRYVVKPVIVAFNLYKEDRIEDGLECLNEMTPPLDAQEPWFRWHDWNIAMYRWLMRICDKRNAKIQVALRETQENYERIAKEVWKNGVWTNAGKELDGMYLIKTLASGSVVIDAKVAEKSPKYIMKRGPIFEERTIEDKQ